MTLGPNKEGHTRYAKRAYNQSVDAGSNGNPCKTGALAFTSPVAGGVARNSIFPKYFVWLQMSLQTLPDTRGGDMSDLDVLPKTRAGARIIETDIPSRLDSLRWSGF